MVARVEAGEPVSEVARQMGVSRQTASRWVGRARRGEPISDRGCRPLALPRLTPLEGEPRRRGIATPVSYERDGPGELLHFDVKKVVRIPDRGGWKTCGEAELRHGGREGGRPRGLRRPLQLGQVVQRLRGPASDATDPRRKQRHGTQYLVNNNTCPRRPSSLYRAG